MQASWRPWTLTPPPPPEPPPANRLQRRSGGPADASGPRQAHAGPRPLPSPSGLAPTPRVALPCPPSAGLPGPGARRNRRRPRLCRRQPRARHPESLPSRLASVWVCGAATAAPTPCPPPLPCSPFTFRSWRRRAWRRLRWRARLAAIAHHHERAGHVPPHRGPGGTIVTEALSGIRRSRVGTARPQGRRRRRHRQTAAVVDRG